MAKLPGNFNAEEHDKLGDFDGIPNGKYHLRIKDTEVKRNSNDTGDLLKLTFEVAEGEFKGRILWANLNITHKTSPAAQEIAEKTLATILDCVGIHVLPDNDTDHLHGCELMAKVLYKAETASKPSGNEVKMYYPLEGVKQPPKPGSAAKKPAVKSGVKKPTLGKKPVGKKKVSFD